MIKFISHCHSYHSFDSELALTSIIQQLNNSDINVVSINDHDIYNLSKYEVNQFSLNGILVIPAIEFTTVEGVHIAGLHPNIKNIEKPAYSYTAEALIHALILLGAKICLPHPFHLTGIYGNSKISQKTLMFVVSNSHSFEVDNYRYGKTPSFLIDKFMGINPKLIQFVGADAHSEKEVNSFINLYPDLNNGKNIESDELIQLLFSSQPEHFRLLERSSWYFRFKKFQKTKFYQKSTNIISHKTRKKLKLLLKVG